MRHSGSSELGHQHGVGPDISSLLVKRPRPAEAAERAYAAEVSRVLETNDCTSFAAFRMHTYPCARKVDRTVTGRYRSGSGKVKEAASGTSPPSHASPSENSS
jgi:hypothetical protein